MKYIILVVLLLFSCRSEQVKPQPDNFVLPIEPEKVATSPFANFSISFSTIDAIVSEGDTFISAKPILSSTITGIAYGIKNSTTTSFISAGAENQIVLSRNLPNGLYAIQAKIFKDNKDTLFKNVFQLTITSSLVKDLTFSESLIVLDSRQDFVSKSPIYYGTKPVTFLLSTQPSASSIAINNTFGNIIVDKSVAPGSYSVSVTTKNSQGFSSFSNVVNISVGGVLNQNPDAISFKLEIAPIISINCKRCHPGYESYSGAFNIAESIYDRVSRPLGSQGKMPQSGSLAAAEIALIKKWIDTGKNP
ncbi:MAG: hypothetical protein ACKVOU_05895 [Cytophagales bacterium]